ncbi:MAG: histone deacetylase [Acidobacteria bacterium]|nr:histone deacetylase [Acidobacteriota bacterium]
MILISSPRFEEHGTPPGHPERPERAQVLSDVAADWREGGGSVLPPRPAMRVELARVHDVAYLDRIEAAAGTPSMLDPDTFTSPESYEIALLAAGAAVQAVEHALTKGETAFAFVRPPGHHAERDKAMGFCLYNNAAVAAAAALASGIERVAVVDIDVHHGNGTQWIFYGEPRVLYVSSHQFPFYPGTGAADDVGHGPGAGFTVNIPLEAGATDADYDLVYRDAVAPIVAQFKPQLTVVSAGFDAHEADPLASMRMSASGYARIVARLRAAAAQSGALALVTEGGYDLPALRDCLQATLSSLAGTAGLNENTLRAQPAPRGARALDAVRGAQSAFWRGL